MVLCVWCPQCFSDLTSFFLLQLVLCVSSDPARQNKLKLQHQVCESASHYTLDQLMPVYAKDNITFTGYRLKWMALPCPNGIPPPPVLGAMDLQVLRPVPVLRAAAASNPVFVLVLCGIYL